jgi:acetyltransferase
MVQRTRIARLLDGYRDHPAVDRAAIVATLIQLSQLAIDFPEIAELDINPLLVDAKGAIALDARIVVRSAAGLPADRLSIRPYPSEIEHHISLDGLDCTIRAIRPNDAGRIVEMLARTAPEDKRLPFPLGGGQPATAIATRLSQIDYDREMALVAVARQRSANAADMIGIARLKADPDNQAAEFTVMIRSDVEGRGLGFRLMTELVDYARRRGLKRLFGLVLSENRTMLRMAGELGFKVAPTEDPGLVHVSIEL